MALQGITLPRVVVARHADRDGVGAVGCRLRSADAWRRVVALVAESRHGPALAPRLILPFQTYGTVCTAGSGCWFR